MNSPHTSSREGKGRVHGEGEGSCVARMLQELSIQCEERDQRYLSGGNFFGPELKAPPPRSPLPSDYLEPEPLLPEPPKSSTPNSNTTKLPGKQRS